MASVQSPELEFTALHPIPFAKCPSFMVKVRRGLCSPECQKGRERKPMGSKECYDWSLSGRCRSGLLGIRAWTQEMETALPLRVRMHSAFLGDPKSKAQ